MHLLSLLCACARPPPAQPSFPTRRSSDLAQGEGAQADDHGVSGTEPPVGFEPTTARVGRPTRRAENASPCGAADRKSTRLNSSHRCISYAVFCLQKKREHTEVITSDPGDL